MMQFLEKSWTKLGILKIGILNLLQQKKQETIWYQNQIIILQSFSQKISWPQNLAWLKELNAREQTCLFRTFNTRTDYYNNV